MNECLLKGTVSKGNMLVVKGGGSSFPCNYVCLPEVVDIWKKDEKSSPHFQED